MDEKKQVDKIVLCGSNAYEKKYYFNKDFDKIPEQVKEDLHIMCVLFTEEVGGIFLIAFDEDGIPIIQTDSDENDFYYDDVSAGLLVKEVQKNKRELFEALLQSIYPKRRPRENSRGSRR